MPVSSARAAALEILLRVEKTDAYASELLHSSRLNALPSADHGLLTEIVLGVLRWRSVLDERIAPHLTQPITKLDIEVLTALRLGAYQLLFLDRVPTHAAVNESVELVKQARKRSAAGMVNAVLRKIPAPPAHSVSQNTRNKGGATAIAAHPAWLVERWTKAYGRERTEGICAYDQLTPRTAVRLDGPALVAELKREGVALEPGRLLAKTFLVAHGDITKTKAFQERRLIIQDEASQLVASLAGEGKLLLDCCAAPGGKTRILAEKNPQATVIAMELHPHRATLLKNLVSSDNVRVIAADVRTIPLSTRFDRVLVDAPCSGTGTLARNPEIRWRLKLEDIERMRAYQLEILLAAMERVAAGGQLIYSTCSLEPEENSEVTERALAGNVAFRKLDCRDELARLRHAGELAIANFESLLDGPYLRTIPGVHACDGFFAAMFQKS